MQVLVGFNVVIDSKSVAQEVHNSIFLFSDKLLGNASVQVGKIDWQLKGRSVTRNCLNPCGVYKAVIQLFVKSRNPVKGG